MKQLTFTVDTQGAGTLTLIQWMLFLFFSSKTIVFSEKESEKMRSASLIKPTSTSESRISQKSRFSVEIASSVFLDSNLTLLNSLLKVTLL